MVVRLWTLLGGRAYPVDTLTPVVGRSTLQLVHLGRRGQALGDDVEAATAHVAARTTARTASAGGRRRIAAACGLGFLAHQQAPQAHDARLQTTATSQVVAAPLSANGRIASLPPPSE